MRPNTSVTFFELCFSSVLEIVRQELQEYEPEYVVHFMQAARGTPSTRTLLSQKRHFIYGKMTIDDYRIQTPSIGERKNGMFLETDKNARSCPPPHTPRDVNRHGCKNEPCFGVNHQRSHRLPFRRAVYPDRAIGPRSASAALHI